MRKMGIDIMVAGVSWQVFTMGLLGIFCGEFAWRICKAGERDLSSETSFVALRRTRRFRLFLSALGLATLGGLREVCLSVRGAERGV